MWIFSNLAISLDGKIATKSSACFPLGTEADRKAMRALRSEADAVLMGADSLRAYRRPLRATGTSKQPANVIISRKLHRVSPNWPFFKEKEIQRFIFAKGPVSNQHLGKFKETSSVILLKKESPQAPVAIQIVRALTAIGIRRLLIEGGGTTMWHFAKHNLIDEYHVTLTPRIVGGTESPTLVDGIGFDPKDVLNLKLVSTRKLGNELFLVYKKTMRRG